MTLAYADITTHDKLQFLNRLLVTRERVYPKLVREKQISLGQAEVEQAVMRAMIHDYQVIQLKESRDAACAPSPQAADR